jgi:hypothetical protein
MFDQDSLPLVGLLDLRALRMQTKCHPTGPHPRDAPGDDIAPPFYPAHSGGRACDGQDARFCGAAGEMALIEVARRGTGRQERGPPCLDLRTYKVRVEEERVLVEI